MSTEILPFRRDGVDVPKLKWGGYIYAIEFSTGLVKVGKSQNPAKRLESHRGHGAAFGADITRYWVSVAHDNYSENETFLIEAMKAMGGKANRAEYFSGVRIEDAVARCQTFEYMHIDIEAHETRSAAKLGVFRALLHEQFGQPDARAEPQDPYSPIDQMFGAIIGTVNNAHHYPIVRRGTVPLSMLRPFAELEGIPVSEVANWNMIDLLEETVKLRAHVAAMQLKLWAIEHERHDLLASMIVEVSA